MAMLQHYWVSQFHRQLDKTLRDCYVCRRNNWKPTHQRQAPLPEDRLSTGENPFASTGVDCFGTFLIPLRLMYLHLFRYKGCPY